MGVAIAASPTNRNFQILFKQLELIPIGELHTLKPKAKYAL